MTEQLILALIDKFSVGPMAERDLNDGTSHLVLRKFSAEKGPLPTTESAVHLGLPTAKAKETPEGEAITSPIVATYYASPGPDAPAFVKPGAQIKAGDTLCILEAMKMMNHLEAEFDCELLQTHVSSGDFVEYGQTLFTVRRV
jgi:acetyl-CoA carboxylase biotin carboxyl carrier protein